MGLFNYVNAEHDCWLCEEPMTDWQTKDGMPFMETVEVDDPELFNYYANCDNCDAWSEYNFVKATCGWVLEKRMSRSRRENDVALKRIMGNDERKPRPYLPWQHRAKGVMQSVSEGFSTDTVDDVFLRERRQSSLSRYQRDRRNKQMMPAYLYY